MADTHTQALYAGAEAFQQLLRDINAKTEADLSAFFLAHPDREDADGRDYVGVVSMVQSSLEQMLRHSDPDHREGYLRAISDLLCVQVDGFGVDLEKWNPIKTTAPAFARGPAFG